MGKKGRIIRVYPDRHTALVEGVNFVKKHVRPRKIDQQGGIVQMERPVGIGNLMFFCMKCEKPTRLRMKFLDDRSKIRYCSRCEEVVETK